MFKKKIKFEQFVVILLIVILSVALFYFGDNPDVLYLILGAFIGGFNNSFVDKDEEYDMKKEIEKINTDKK